MQHSCSFIPKRSYMKWLSILLSICSPLFAFGQCAGNDTVNNVTVTCECDSEQQVSTTACVANGTAAQGCNYSGGGMYDCGKSGSQTCATLRATACTPSSGGGSDVSTLVSEGATPFSVKANPLSFQKELRFNHPGTAPGCSSAGLFEAWITEYLNSHRNSASLEGER